MTIDLRHDTCFVRHCFNVLYNKLLRRGVTVKKHYIWSDGCASQFKLAQPFLWLSLLHKKTNIWHTWNFFEIRHGKGEHNGVVSCIKHALKRHQLNHLASQLVDSSNVVNWCKDNLSHVSNPRIAHVHR